MTGTRNSTLAVPPCTAARPTPSASRVTRRGFRACTPRAALWLTAFAAATLVAPSFAGKVSIATPEAASACDRCKVQMTFATKMRELGADLEFVELRDGIGVFYTTADTRLVPKIQTANEWARNELVRLGSTPLDDLHLCQYCKASRPIYSRIDREVVRTERGAFFVMRSDDPEAVRALHEMRRMALAQGRATEKPAPAPSR